MKILLPDYDRFLHYGGRTSPWIKLHRSLLLNAKFMTLAAEEQMFMIGLWLLASARPMEEGCGVVECSYAELRFMLPMRLLEGEGSPMVNLEERGLLRLADVPGGCRMAQPEEE